MTFNRGARELREPDLPFACSWAPIGPRAARSASRGELDMATGPLLADALAAAVDAAPLVLLHMEDVTFMDCAGLRVLWDAATAARETGRTAASCPPDTELKSYIVVAMPSSTGPVPTAGLCLPSDRA